MSSSSVMVNGCRLSTTAFCAPAPLIRLFSHSLCPTLSPLQVQCTAYPPIPSSSPSPSPKSKPKAKPKPIDRGSTLLLVGLGNPGPAFVDTPHNIGFSLVTSFASSLNAPSFTPHKSLQALHTSAVASDASTKIHILKPTTFMNLSGRSVAAALKYFNIPNSALLIVADDVSLETGRIRLRARGSAGGHNGLKSVQSSLGGSMEYARLKIGVGSPNDSSRLKEYVLNKFSKSEQKLMDGVEIDVLNVLDHWKKESDITRVMNQIGMLQSGQK